MDNTGEQRLAALAKANDVREARARLKRELQAGERSLAHTLKQPPQYIYNMRIGELMTAPRGFGTVRATKLLAGCAIAYSRRIGSLSERQRIVVAEAVDNEYERAYEHAKGDKSRPSRTMIAGPSTGVQV